MLSAVLLQLRRATVLLRRCGRRVQGSRPACVCTVFALAKVCSYGIFLDSTREAEKRFGKGCEHTMSGFGWQWVAEIELRCRHGVCATHAVRCKMMDAPCQRGESSGGGTGERWR